MARVHVLATAVGLALALSAPAEAYEPRETHRWLARMAAEHLARAYPGQYDELLEYIDTVAEGAEHEDDLFIDGDDDPETLRVMRHFMRPTDGSGLILEGRGTYPSSIEWALPNDINPWHWGNGIDAYAAGDRNEAYFVLGHIVHLVQDLTVPAHSHLDVHSPPFGDDYENYAASMMLGEFDSQLPTPPEDAPIPEFEDLEEALYTTAEVSYYRNRYPGDLSDPDAPEGVIAEMFPSLEVDWISDNWRIDDPPVGALGSGFFEDEDESGWFYFKKTAYPARVDKLDFDPSNPRELGVIANNADDAAMVELLAEDLVPVAILHSAAVMKLYLDEAYARAPGEPDPGDDEPPPGGGAGAGCAAAPTSSAAPLALAFALCPLLRIRRPR